MTRAAPILVLADDLTGAAELAAIGRGFGLRAIVAHGMPRPGKAPPLLVCDTDSRLLPPAMAARLVRQAVERRPAGAMTFKKTDSVLRGNVLAEVAALAERVRCPRVLLVPANPSLGRTIREGRYFIGGTPLHRTPFARDPHHPARSSRVVDLLGPARSLPVHVLPPGTPLPARGVIVGEVTSPADLAYWAGRVEADTLAAGGGEFFQAWLRARGHKPGKPPVPTRMPGPTLVISGTTAPTGRIALQGLASANPPLVSMVPVRPPRPGSAALHQWTGEIAGRLADQQRAVILPPRRLDRRRGAAEAFRAAFAALVKQLHRRRAFTHLIVEGGATAAAIVEALGWRELSVIGAWSQGVVTLEPTRTPRCRFTIKPGSYPWPERLRRELAARTPARRTSAGRPRP